MEICMIELSKEQQQWIDSHYALLPKGADGEPIHIGDKLVGKYLEGNPLVKCTRLTLTNDWMVGNGRGEGKTDWMVGHGRGEGTPSLYAHYHEPTVEDVLEKALNEAAMLDRESGYWPSAADITNIVNEIAPKLRLRKDGE